MDRGAWTGYKQYPAPLNTKHTINNRIPSTTSKHGSFFRIRHVQLASNFDKTLISRIGMQALKLYVNIQNLKTWKHNTGYTPELGGTAIAFGVDDGSYPMPAIYHIRLQSDILTGIAPEQSSPEEYSTLLNL